MFSAPRILVVLAWLGACLATGPVAGGERQPLAPHAPAVLQAEPLAEWKFSSAAETWQQGHDAQAQVAEGALQIKVTGDDAWFVLPFTPAQGPLEVTWRMRSTARGPAEVFWTTAAHPHFAAERRVTVATHSNGNWATYTATLAEHETITQLRFDPAVQPGEVALDDFRVARHVLHPLQFAALAVSPLQAQGAVRNAGEIERQVTVGTETARLASGQTWEFSLPLGGEAPFEMREIACTSPDLPPLVRRVAVHRPAAETRWLELRSDNVRVQVAPDGAGARLWWQGEVVGVLAPLVERQGEAVVLAPQSEQSEGALQFSGGVVRRLSLALQGNVLTLELEADQEVNFPRVRALGKMEQALLAGVEHLGQGETSSSKLDLERAEHVRYEPSPLLLTMPLSAFVTERASLALLWSDSLLQPVFAAPNVYDSTGDQLLALRGTKISAHLRLGPGFASGATLEDAIEWAVRTRGLPEPPPAPRSPAAQAELSLAALQGVLKTERGWLHAVGMDPNHANWFADHASTYWRLTGQVPQAPRFVPGGSHEENPAIFFVTGRADQWLAMLDSRAAALRKQQQPDGSFRYEGAYARGHFENTASGYCARHALTLLDHARYTGHEESRAAGLKTLEYLRRFRTPRGAQTWEIPLHTPDILAASHLLRAYVRGYELTGNAEYLKLARRWAWSGLPYVYQWDGAPIMRYSTVAVLGATHWTGVVWIGLPVQWCGTCYAVSLLDLAEHDHSFAWRQVAEGITACAEQMQYPAGERLGLLPDSFNLPNQQRLPADINPCVLVLLRRRLAGEPADVVLAANERYRVVAPFPVTLAENVARVAAPEGLAFQVLVNGQFIAAGKGGEPLNLAEICRPK